MFTPDSTDTHRTVIDLDVIDRYLAGELPAEELAVFQRLLFRDSEHQQLIETLQAIPVIAGAKPQAVAPEVVGGRWREHATRLFGRPGGVMVQGGWEGFKAHPLPRNVWYTLAGAAAATTVFFGGQRLGSSQWGVDRHVVMSTYTTDNGQRANITLPDGGTVALNVASRLDVPADYLMGNHTVRLAGEALFTVRHHAGAPLTVLAGRTTTRVLGTTFMVRHYAADSSTTIAVQEGRVAVHTEGRRPIVLAPAQQLVVGRRGEGDVRWADRSLFSFATGVLSLTRVPLPLAIVELNRWYDADIRLADPRLWAQNFTGDCAAGSLADLTDMLQATYNVRVVREGRVLTLFSR